ncbi:hypothetical protein [Pusillimonas sp. ANT_WB101]|uniref:hypothetical protein n=1 Tax=Pusillimonas sp. ANT_WB101 TaxID=2597356 RepID=UPI00165EA0EA|nr:hypothetical protein [Pusillimonas sp. ANT_WB101]
MTHAKLTPGQTSTPIDIKGPPKAKREEDAHAELGIESPLKNPDDKGKSKESRDDQ